MKKHEWKIYLAVLVWLLFLSCSFSQSQSINWEGLIEVFDTSYAVKPITSISSEDIYRMRLRIKKHTQFDSYIKKSLPLEVCYRKGVNCVAIWNFKGIDELNAGILFEEINSYAEPENVIVIACGSRNHKRYIFIPIESPTGISFAGIIVEAALRNVFLANTDVSVGNFDSTKFHWIDRPIIVDEMVKLKGYIRLKNCRFIIDEVTHGKLKAVSSVYFRELTLINCQNINLSLRKCRIEQFNFKGSQGVISIDNCDLSRFYLNGAYSNVEIKSSAFHFTNTAVEISATVGALAINNNHFQALLDINQVTVSDKLKITGNVFDNKLFLSELNFPTSSAELDWSQFSGNKLAVPDALGYLSKNSYYGTTDIELGDRTRFIRLIKSYQKIYNHFKEIGDIESANACYSKKKEIEGGRLKIIYMTKGGFKNYISWKLNSLMRYYTEYGTDPAKAIVISVWVVVFFGVFYFFFPSDWDVSSKSKLIQNFKYFIEKNEKGYFRPFFNLTVGLILSLLNAFTLSLNSFVTLGFGNIPTHGLARYVTIAEGFIGWFLLSIFSVALINQALA